MADQAQGNADPVQELLQRAKIDLDALDYSFQQWRPVDRKRFISLFSSIVGAIEKVDRRRATGTAATNEVCIKRLRERVEKGEKNIELLDDITSGLNKLYNQLEEDLGELQNRTREIEQTLESSLGVFEDYEVGVDPAKAGGDESVHISYENRVSRKVLVELVEEAFVDPDMVNKNPPFGGIVCKINESEYNISRRLEATCTEAAPWVTDVREHEQIVQENLVNAYQEREEARGDEGPPASEDIRRTSPMPSFDVTLPTPYFQLQEEGAAVVDVRGIDHHRYDAVVTFGNEIQVQRFLDLAGTWNYVAHMKPELAPNDIHLGLSFGVTGPVWEHLERETAFSRLKDLALAAYSADLEYNPHTE